MNRVFIAEKPSVGRAIAAHLGHPQKNNATYITCGDDAVTWCRGHILEDLKPEDYNEDWSWEGVRTALARGYLEQILPIFPDQFKLRVSKDAKDQYETIKRLVRDAQTIVHAGDIDREGQLIVDEVLDFLDVRKRVLRLNTASLDDVNLAKALRELTPNADKRPITIAGYTRREADFGWGMTFTVAYTLAANQSGWRDGVLNVGRVKTPTMRLVVERDLQIEAFRPVPYFTVAGVFSFGDARFQAQWQPNGDAVALDPEGRLLDRAPADALANSLAAQPATVREFKNEERAQKAPLLFSLSELQAEASKRYGFAVNQTLQIAQRLYELKLTTYPRTDCRYLPEAQLADAPRVLAAIASNDSNLRPFIDGADAVRKSDVWNDRKTTAHHAIIPTMQAGDITKLGEEERKLYDLIARSYIAQFLPEHRYRQIRVSLECMSERFVATGRVALSPGWKALYGAAEADDRAEGEDEVEQPIPTLTVGQQGLCAQAKTTQKTTQPPKRYTEGTLVKAMASIHEQVQDPQIRQRLRENDGVGTEATRGPIIEQLKKGEFLVAQGKNIISTTRARALVAPKTSAHPGALHERVASYETTALFEQNLSAIAEAPTAAAALALKEKFLGTLRQFLRAGAVTALATKISMPPGTTVGTKRSGGRRGGGAGGYKKRSPRPGGRKKAS